MTVLICDDMALHRSMRGLACRLDPTDEVQLRNVVDVLSLRQLLEREGKAPPTAALAADVVIELPTERQQTEQGWKVLSPASIETLAQSGRAVARLLLTVIRQSMTPELAAFVRGLRVEEYFSWRAIARYVADSKLAAWPHKPDNQLAGMALCAAAAELPS